MAEYEAPFRPLLLFDGVCNLCNRSVHFVLRHDRANRLRFASLQSDAAAQALRAAQAPEQLPDSVVLIDDKGVHTQSTAAIRAAMLLGFPWSLLALFWIIPRPVRNFLYDAIAKRRYRWFGRRDTCMVPSADVRDRFIDADESIEVPGVKEQATASASITIPAEGS